MADQFKITQTISARGVTLISCLALIIFIASIDPILAADSAVKTNIKIGSTCFAESECDGAPYQGISKEAYECQIPTTTHSQEAVDRGIVYNCYAKQPTSKLQVSIGGYEVKGIEQYIKRLYVWLAGMVGIVAALMLVWAGLKWLTSGGIPDRISDAKKKIIDALIGMVLVLGSFAILNTINPALVNLRLPPIKLIRQSNEITESSCKNIPQFPCGGILTEKRYRVDGQPAREGFFPGDIKGTYPCSKAEYNEYNPCGSQAVQECRGVYCEGREPRGGCFDIHRQRVTESAKNKITSLGLDKRLSVPVRVCVNPSECSNCASLKIKERELDGDVVAANPLTDEGLYNLRICVSGLCDCLVNTNDNGDGLICVKRKPAGADCEIDEECSKDLKCLPTRIVNNDLQFYKCQRVPLDNDKVCLHDQQCKSRLCSRVPGSDGGFCTKGQQGDPCASGDRCAPGFRCINTAGRNECYDGRRGSPCCSALDCKPGGGGCNDEISLPGGSLCAWTGTCR